MPDKNTPWTPDETFWNEGWADMEHRLDRKKRRGLLLPLLFGIFLLCGAIGAGALVLGSADQEPTPISFRPATPEPGPSAGSRSQPGPARDNVVEVEAQFDAPLAPLQASPAPAPPTTPTTPTLPIPHLTTGIPVLPLDLLPSRMALPELAIHTEKQPLLPVQSFPRYILGAGGSSYPSSYLPGAFAFGGRQFALGRWFVPVTLRYDYSRRQFQSASGAPDYGFSPITGTPNVTGMQDQPGFEDFQLTTQTLALRAGLGRRLGRVNLSAGGEAAYLLGGRGPTYSVVTTGGRTLVNLQEERFTAANYSNRLGSATNGVTGSAPLLVPTSALNRYLFSLWMRTDVRLSGNFHLTLGLTRGLTPLYREEALRVEATRLELGAVYTIR